MQKKSHIFIRLHRECFGTDTLSILGTLHIKVVFLSEITLDDAKLMENLVVYV
jgi:hypothetical protein